MEEDGQLTKGKPEKAVGSTLKVENNDEGQVVVELPSNDFITTSLSQRVTRGDEG